MKRAAIRAPARRRAASASERALSPSLRSQTSPSPRMVQHPLRLCAAAVLKAAQLHALRLPQRRRTSLPLPDEVEEEAEVKTRLHPRLCRAREHAQRAALVPRAKLLLRRLMKQLTLHARRSTSRRRRKVMRMEIGPDRQDSSAVLPSRPFRRAEELLHAAEAIAAEAQVQRRKTRVM